MTELFSPVRQSPFKRGIYWGLLVAVFLLLATGLIVFAPQPTANPQQPAPPSVPVVAVMPEDTQIPLRSHGQVQMTREYQLSNRVQGRVVFMSDRLVSGGTVNAGELLLQLDAQVYELEVSRKQAELDSRLLQLAEVQAQANVAQQQAADNDFARFIPQLRMATSQADAARAALNYARQQLQDTHILAPVTGRLSQVRVQPGQDLLAGQILASVQDQNWQEIPLTISDDEARLLQLPNAPYALTVRLYSSHSTGDHNTSDQRTINAHIVRSEAQRANFQQIVLIARPDYGTDDETLLPGTYVEADILTPVLPQVIAIPRAALQADNRVLLIDEAQTIQSVAADIVYGTADTLYLRNALPSGTLVVNSSRRSLLPGRAVTPVLLADASQAIAAETPQNATAETGREIPAGPTGNRNPALANISE
ncbi:efflux RND transporter periplasmic adaptor subunit [Thalassolituus sp. LLYu03]|uniref:efflux RND transporter periplasmic adaptor subunit n=1 Tax=Thalassolituus sp. LLYu03 TaxID=3421656 RepID=UPI003D2C65C7